MSTELSSQLDRQTELDLGIFKGHIEYKPRQGRSKTHITTGNVSGRVGNSRASVKKGKKGTSSRSRSKSNSKYNQDSSFKLPPITQKSVVAFTQPKMEVKLVGDEQILQGIFEKVRTEMSEVALAAFNKAKANGELKWGIDYTMNPNNRRFYGWVKDEYGNWNQGEKDRDGRFDGRNVIIGPQRVMMLRRFKMHEEHGDCLIIFNDGEKVFA